LPFASGEAFADDAPKTEWIRSYGGEGNDVIYSVSPTSDGGIIAAGSSHSSKGDVEFHRGAGDSWLLKLDRDGNVQFKRSLGGSANDYAFSAAETEDGGYVAAGATSSSDGDFGGRSGRDSDPWVVRLNRWGHTQWLRTYGTAREDFGKYVFPEPGGGYVLLGSAVSPGRGIGCEIREGSLFPWAALIAEDGSVLGESCLGGGPGRSSGDFFYRLFASRAEGYPVAFAGSAYDRKDRSAPFSGKVGPGGDIRGLRAIPAQGARTVLGVSALRGGALEGVGHRGAVLRTGRECPPPWLFRVGHQGGLDWEAELEEADGCAELSSVARYGGGLAAAGFRWRPGETGSGARDASVLMAGPGGEIIWELAVKGGSGDRVTGLAQLKDGGLAAAGDTYSRDGDFAFRGPSAAPEGAEEGDAFVIRLAPAEAVSKGLPKRSP
jgi:hypothetical protein